ncbi:hypothetical protein ACJ72_02952 [Emergomyces africanus]|uniref:Uncharacterized protein n=1 Tax=Emergomyces africanus TaxID=1955775 RepID=A0A1B7P102_9EURO|nr:hypothetical protein ACJ72_02952 [Emergomyces africanus]
MDRGGRDAGTAQNSETPFMPTQDGRNILMVNSDIFKGRSSRGGTVAPNTGSGGWDLPPFNPRSAIDAERELPPLAGVLEDIAKELENSDSPRIEYVMDSNAQHLNNMRNLLQTFSGMWVATRGREITLPPLNLQTLGDIHNGKTTLPSLHDVFDDIANDIENGVRGFLSTVVPADSNSEYLLNMKMAFPPISAHVSSNMGNVTNQPSGTGSYRTRTPEPSTAIRESIIHGRATTPNLSNSLINQPLENRDQVGFVESPIRVEEPVENTKRKERVQSRSL